MKMFLSNVYSNILFNLIIREYFVEHRCLLILSDGDFDYNGFLPSVKAKIVDGQVDYGKIFNYYGCQGVIIYSKNVTKVFKNFEKEIHLRLERFNKRRFLILAGSNDEKTFFNMEELNFVSDLLLVLPLNDGFELKTHKYVGSSNHNDLLFLDRWFSKNQSFLYGRNLYPDKLTNQLGRPLKMAAFTYEPYSIIGNTIEQHQGSELRSGVEFGLKFNMTPIPIVNEKDYWGEIFPNWSGNGLLGNLVLDKADIGFSALYTWEYCYHYLDLSKPLVRTGITCLVPAPKLAARWLTPLLSYSPKLWLCVTIIIASAILALSLILSCYSRNKTLIIEYHRCPKKKSYFVVLATSTSTVLKPILLQPLPPNKTPEQLATKFMLGLIHILGLLLTSTYDSGFATVMTLPRYEDAIDTIEDFASSGLDWGATQDAWITSIQNAKEPIYVQIVSKFHPISEEALEEFSKSGSFAFSIERLPFDNYAIGDYIKDEVIGNFHVMEQDLYWEQCVIMLRKNSILLPFLDMFILRIFEAGLISKWQNKAVNMFMNPYVQRAVRFYRHRLQEHKVVQLKWSHVEGAFAILAIGHILSFVVFVVEVLINKKE